MRISPMRCRREPGRRPAARRRRLRGGPGRFDVLLRGGMVYDGTGAAPSGRTSASAATGSRRSATSTARPPSWTSASPGYAVAPGFINMLSWATESLIVDGRSLGDIRQGVTTEIFGEGTSLGPLTPEMKTRWKSEQGDIKFDYEWTTLSGYLQIPRKTRRDAERRVVHRRRHDPRARRRTRQPAADAGRARPHARARSRRRWRLARSASGRR